jgi:prepilin-type N-terminal cleavage/methylation domain-containing protein
MRRPSTLRNAQAQQGFSLVELLLAMSLGLVFCGVMIQALLGEGQNAQHFTRALRERAYQRRAVALIRDDLERALQVLETPATDTSTACGGLGGRRRVLSLETPEGTVVYSVGAAPSAIWRGRVLMRCGPAFLENGQASAGAFQSRVVLDGLATDATAWQGCGGLDEAHELNGSAALPFSACLESGTRILAVRLQQSFAASGRTQRITSERVLGAG